MAVVPKQSIYEASTIKPSSFVVWCLLCQVKDKRQQDVYLDIEKAEQAGIKSSAFYFALKELETKGWISFSRKIHAQKRWYLVKGISPDNSLNAENPLQEDSTNTEKLSANVENNSANVEIPLEPLIRNKPTKNNKPNKQPQIDVSSGAKPHRPKTAFTDSQLQNFNEGMAFLKQKIGNFPDGGGQGRALKWMLLHGATITQIKNGLERQITEFQGRYRASYLSLQKVIFQWIQEGNGEIRHYATNQKLYRNGYAKQTNAEIWDSYGYYK